MGRNWAKRAITALIVVVCGAGVAPACTAPAAGAATGGPISTLLGGVVETVEGVVEGVTATPVSANVDLGQGGLDAAVTLAGLSADLGLDLATGVATDLAVRADALLQTTAGLALGPEGLDVAATVSAPPLGVDLDVDLHDGMLTAGLGVAGIRADLTAGVDPSAVPAAQPALPPEVEVGAASDAGAPVAHPAPGLPSPGRGLASATGAPAPVRGLVEAAASAPGAVDIPGDLQLVSAEARLVADNAGHGVSSPLAMLRDAGTRLLPGLLLLAAALVMRRRAAALLTARSRRVVAPTAA